MSNLKNILTNLKRENLKGGFLISVSLIAILYFSAYMLFLIIKDLFNFYYINYESINTVLIIFAFFGVPAIILIKLNGYENFKEMMSNIFTALFYIIGYLLVILFIAWIINSWTNLLDIKKLQWIGFIIILLLISIIANKER